MRLLRRQSAQRPSENWIVYLLAISAIASLGGCGSSNDRVTPDNLVPVSGKVLLNDEPADRVSLSFIPDRGTSGVGGFAVTDEQGNFTAQHMTQIGDNAGDPTSWGLEAGTYQVTFSRIRMPDGSPLPDDLEASGKTAVDIGARETLPPRLTRIAAEMPANQLRVPFDGKELVFKLKMDTK